MKQNLQESIPELLTSVAELNVAESLKTFADAFPGTVSFSSSFSFEDQIITHLILTNHIDIEIFTLDTGRLFPETYSVWSRTNERYNTKIKAYYPAHPLVEKYLDTKGPNAFYESVQNRKDCCFIRKVEPLQRALKGKEIWVTGLRSEHSAARENLEIIEWDDANKIIKFHPLLHWSMEEVNEYVKANNIPYNSLHDKGFISIGCAPCTRAIQPGEHPRAGRWWWEDESKKECGLHVKTTQHNNFSI